ncbi:hypothetical protein J437_LFUL018962 [Ladona fulva]|uniref:Cytochrome P450 n=1 Tax=Ladona fulva TaxID=123851 RepID=A0A8K0KS11_LADFU|nr:hypothetical protein J437_LFUL018962 [Ladona fulva]
MFCTMTFLGMQWGPLDIFITTLIALFLAFLWYGIAPLTYWRRKGIPSVFALPVLGSTAKMAFLLKSFGQVTNDMYFQTPGKKYVGYHKFTLPMILLRDPDIVKNVLNRDFVHFDGNELKMDEVTDDVFSGRHLFLLSGEKWKRLRVVLSPGFSSGKMKSMFPTIGEVSGNLRAFLTEKVDSAVESGYAVDLKDLCARYTTDSVASVAFGLQCDSIYDPEVEFRRMGRKLLEPTLFNAIMFLIMFEMPWLNRFLKINFISKDVTSFFRNVVLNVVAKREEDGTKLNDYFQGLIQLWKEGKLRVSEKPIDDGPDGRHVTADTLRKNLKELDDITAQALSFVTDGFETSSTLIAFCLFELAHNPKVQEKLRKEIEAKIRQNDGTLTYDALQDMTYLDMVIHETLRMYPPGMSLNRMCSKRYYLPNPEGEGLDGGLWLEEGMVVTIPVYGLHHDPEIYPDPEKFDPERFSPDNKRDKQAIYLPFGDGPKMCIGSRFALLQSKLAVVSVVSRFQLSPNEKTKVPITIDPFHVVLNSKYGLWVNMKNLKQ